MIQGLIQVRRGRWIIFKRSREGNPDPKGWNNLRANFGEGGQLSDVMAMVAAHFYAVRLSGDRKSKTSNAAATAESAAPK